MNRFWIYAAEAVGFAYANSRVKKNPKHLPQSNKKMHVFMEKNPAKLTADA